MFKKIDRWLAKKGINKIMCYSIKVETSFKKIQHNFAADVDYKRFLRVYENRSKGLEHFNIPRNIDRNFSDLDTAIGENIRDHIQTFNRVRVEKIEKKLAEKKSLRDELLKKIEKKWSKTSQKKLETTERVLSRSLSQLEKILKDPCKEEDSRVFMYSYSPSVISEPRTGQKKIIPLRYQIRPAGSLEEFPTKINGFNARIDSLHIRKNWRRLFMKSHAAIMLSSFFEWVVGPQQKDQVVEFFPENGHCLWSPALWDSWTSTDGKTTIESYAILTRDPSLEVAAVGHDRSPQFMDTEFMNSWLSPEVKPSTYFYDYFKTHRQVKMDHRFHEKA
tara:strand:+ start:133 stop:1131 length:999 start_codon:yes stop_codon:yes gene_type:complete